MIADQKIGKSFLGALNYNLKKLYHPDKDKRAVLLDNNFSSIDSRMIQKELRLVRSLRPNLSRYVYHTSLNFSNEDQLENEKLLEIAHEYLKESGYTNNQYMIFRHYDADHPHIHLLVNRICFDGSVVSDSNNYKKSEAVLRKLEYRYNLVKVEQSVHLSKDMHNGETAERANRISANRSSGRSAERGNRLPKERNNKRSIELGSGVPKERNNKRPKEPGNGLPKDRNSTILNKRDNSSSADLNTAISANQHIGITSDQNSNKAKDQNNTVPQKAPTKNELEMVMRTGKPSEKMVLQELVKKLLKVQGLTIPDMISKAEKAGIHFLFNQASTGLVTGITYFHNDFKIKGQTLGNQFKWGELTKKVDYEQDRDSEAISNANGRTRNIYGTKDQSQNRGESNQGAGKGNDKLFAGDRANPKHINSEPTSAVTAGTENRTVDESMLNTQGDADNYNDMPADFDYSPDNFIQAIQITDDVDDEAVYGKQRHREKQKNKRGR